MIWCTELKPGRLNYVDAEIIEYLANSGVLIIGESSRET